MTKKQPAKTDVRKTIERCVARLFDSGTKREQDRIVRLVVETAGGKFLGGWCFDAVCDQIENELNKILAETAKGTP